MSLDAIVEELKKIERQIMQDYDADAALVAYRFLSLKVLEQGTR